MSKETLHTLRLIFPGLVLLIVALLLMQGDKNILDIQISTDSLVYLIVVFGIGVIFYAIGPRFRIMKKQLIRVNENIKNRLISPFTEDPDLQKSIPSLLNGTKLMNVFYNFIDNDESLKARSIEVYQNGFIWSSLVDIEFLSPICLIIFLVEFFLTKNNHLLVYSGIFLILFLLSILLIPRIIKRHIDFSNNQLDYITQVKKKELKEKLINLIS
jgi:hypothetical protein